ncbi:MAG: rubredoxin [Candidatus Helarchaeota archaeon]|nr:rubredoxin [Candidatus Helarchaeota archaeon]
MARWRCRICGYVYDEEKQGTPFEQLSEFWRCPKCNAPKDKFVKIP